MSLESKDEEKDIYRDGINNNNQSSIVDQV